MIRFAGAIAALLFFSCMQPLLAAGIAKTVKTQPNAPIAITACYADVRFVHTPMLNQSYLNTGVDFVTHGATPVSAAMFQFQLVNLYGELLDPIVGEATGQFRDGVEIKGNHWSSIDVWPGLSIVECSVSRVLFADGKTWLAPVDKTPPTPTP